MLVLQLDVGANDTVFVILPDGRRGRIVLTRTRRNRALVGFEFPDDVKILRQSVLPKLAARTTIELGHETSGRS